MSRALCIALLGAILALPAPARGQEEQKDPRQECAARLKALGSMCLLYAEEHGGKLPESLSALYYQAYVNDLEEFVCPATPTNIEGRTEIDEKAGYVLSFDESGGDPRPIIKDRSPDNHGGEGTNVFYSDGQVGWQAGQGPQPEPPPAQPEPEGPPTPEPSPPEPTAGTRPEGGPEPTDTAVVTYGTHPDVHITDLKPVSIQEGAWGRTQFDQSITGGELRIGNVAFRHGIGTHANSTIEYNIGGLGFADFVAYVGIDYGAVVPDGSCLFQVFADEDERFNSGVLKNGDLPKPVRVDVGGARSLKLVVTDAGDGVQYDQANWAEAGFLNPLPQPGPAGQPRPGAIGPDGLAAHEPEQPQGREVMAPPPTVAAAGWTGEYKPKWWIAEGGPIKDARLCSDIRDGKPVGVGTSFPATTTKVGLYVEFDGGPDEQTFVVAWNRGDKRLLRGLLTVEGSKRAVFYIHPARMATFKPGRYRAEVLLEKKPVARLEFELTAASRGARP